MTSPSPVHLDRPLVDLNLAATTQQWQQHKCVRAIVEQETWNLCGYRSGHSPWCEGVCCVEPREWVNLTDVCVWKLTMGCSSQRNCFTKLLSASWTRRRVDPAVDIREEDVADCSQILVAWTTDGSVWGCGQVHHDSLWDWVGLWSCTPWVSAGLGCDHVHHGSLWDWIGLWSCTPWFPVGLGWAVIMYTMVFSGTGLGCDHVHHGSVLDWAVIMYTMVPCGTGLGCDHVHHGSLWDWVGLWSCTPWFPLGLGWAMIMYTIGEWWTLVWMTWDVSFIIIAIYRALTCLFGKKKAVWILLCSVRASFISADISFLINGQNQAKMKHSKICTSCSSFIINGSIRNTHSVIYASYELSEGEKAPVSSSCNKS